MALAKTFIRVFPYHVAKIQNEHCGQPNRLGSCGRLLKVVMVRNECCFFFFSFVIMKK